MPFRRRTGNGPGPHSRCALFSSLVICVVTPLIFLAAQNGRFSSISGGKDFLDVSTDTVQEYRKLSAFEHVENMFPKEVINVIMSNIDDSGPLSLNAVRRKDLSSSWVIEEPLEVSFNALQKPKISGEGGDITYSRMLHKGNMDMTSRENTSLPIEVGERLEVVGTSEKEEDTEMATDRELSLGVSEQTPDNKLSPAQDTRRKMRMERKEKRLTEIIQQTSTEVERDAIARTREVNGGGSALSKYSIWRRENDEASDSLVRLMRDQLIMARVYSSLATSHKKPHLLRDLRLRIRESQQTLGEATVDSGLPRSALERVKSMGQMLSRAREQLYDCTAITKKLRAMVQSAEEQARVLKKQSTFLSQLAAKTLPKGLHCFSMRLTIEYYGLHEDQREFSGQDKLQDNDLFHYALFSDNVLAVSVVVNSTASNAKEPWKHVFHLVTDKLNYAAMRMWFLANPPGEATIEILNIDGFSWLNSSYCPVLQQLESAAMKEYYFKADHSTTLAAGSSNLKYRNPKYLSMLNHLRFYLPEVYPKLDKILFLDDDIVVQKDLTSLWSVNLHGKVNGAVETCGQSFHRFDKYLNFSNLHIRRNFDPHACGWAYGMNVFDLQEWKKRDITGIYHRWQSMNEDRVLWKLGTLPPGLITFYNLTYPLNKSWHVLGLGYNPSVDQREIEGAAVVHYNGNMKPWLELAIAKYKHHWTRYVKYDHHFLQQCNIN